MEQLNQIEIRGMIGSVRKSSIGDATVVNFSAATSVAYRNQEGSVVMETTWHQVTAWRGKGIDISDLERLHAGCKIYVKRQNPKSALYRSRWTTKHY